MGGGSSEEDNIPTDPSIRFTESCGFRMGKSAFTGAAGGVMMGAAILAWYPDPYRFGIKGTIVNYDIGLRYVLRHMKAPVVWGALVCGVFTGVECLMEGMRDELHQSTYVNSAVAGAAAGLVMGGISKRIDIMATSALGVGMIMGMAEFNGSALLGNKEHAKIKWEAAMIKPNETTVDELKEKYPEFKHL